jgi:hypothetical protein
MLLLCHFEFYQNCRNFVFFPSFPSLSFYKPGLTRTLGERLLVLERDCLFSSLDVIEIEGKFLETTVPRGREIYLIIKLQNNSLKFVP